MTCLRFSSSTTTDEREAVVRALQKAGYTVLSGGRRWSGGIELATAAHPNLIIAT